MLQLSRPKLYLILLRDTLANDGNTWKVEQYLKTLCKSDPSFDFCMARNGENGAATANLWQTGTMRADFGCALHVDFMKSKMNCFELLYISIVVVDGNWSSRCVAEGITCVERHEAYIFVIKAMLEKAPGQS